MIHLADINKSIQTKDRGIVRALREINLKIGPQEFVALLGPRGSGKSSLLRVAGFLESPDSGTCIFGGKSIGIPYSGNLLRQAARSTSFLFSKPVLIEELNIYENTALALRHFHFKSGQKKDLVYRALDATGILHRANQYPNRLSVFQQQLAALSRAIVTDPRILLADEPMKPLSRPEGITLVKLLTKLNENGLTILLATEDPYWLAFTRRTLNMSGGKIITSNSGIPATT